MTQERISPGALTYIANEMRTMIDDPFHGPRLRTLVPEALDQAASRLSEMEAEIKRLREALERVLLDVDFMWEDGTLPNRRDDVIYVRARAALEQQKGETP